MHHYWNAPTVPPGTPGPATVVVRSNCNITQTMPVWMFRRWQAEAPTDLPPLRDTCPLCLLDHIERLAETDLDAAQALASRALHPSVKAIGAGDYMRLAGRLHRKQAAARREQH